MVRVFAGDAQTVTELIDKITDGLGHPETALSRRVALAKLRSAGESRPGTLIVVHAVSGEAGHDLFGRMRDDLWEMDVRWLVGARSDDAAVLLRPPADAFFETTVLLGADGDPSLALAAARQVLLVGDPRKPVFTTLSSMSVSGSVSRPRGFTRICCVTARADRQTRRSRSSPGDQRTVWRPRTTKERPMHGNCKTITMSMRVGR